MSKPASTRVIEPKPRQLRADEDAAAVIAAVVTLAATASGMTKPAAPQSFWTGGDISPQPGSFSPGPGAWWASGLPR